MLEINNFFAYFRAKRKNFCAKHAKMKQSSFSNGLRRVARVDENGNSDYFYVRKLPSVNKGRHGFDGQKYAHIASIPLTIQQVFSSGLSLSVRIWSSGKTALHLSVMNFRVIFVFLRCRRAGARQGEKDKKRRKGTLSGVFALVNRW